MGFVQASARFVSGLLGRESPVIKALRPAYETALNWASLGRGIAWRINGEAFRIDARYRRQMGPDYDPPVAAYLRTRLRPGSVSLDVGANVGVYVLQMARFSEPDGRVVAFEPVPAARAVLERHLAMNCLAGRVTLVPAAVSSLPGRAAFFAAAADGRNRLGEANPAIAAEVSALSVDVVTLDGWCRDNGVAPDAMVIDVEGFEWEVLAGARETVSSRPAMTVVIEVHPSASPVTPPDKARALVEGLGRRPVGLTGQSDPWNEHGLVALEPSRA
jgi:FkbM family methyltransferase